MSDGLKDFRRFTFDVAKMDIIEQNNSSFLRAKFWAISEGSTRNDVAFTLESIKKAIPTVRNKPVLAAFNKDTNEFEEHNDLGVRVDEDTGAPYFDYDSGLFDKLTQRPIGVIPSESNVQIEEYEGKKWLTFDVLIWVIYAHRAAKKLRELGQERISVEVTATDFYMNAETGEVIIDEFIFNGVTVIGVEEGIEGAHLKVGDFAQTNTFAKFHNALMFAFSQKQNKGDSDAVGLKNSVSNEIKEEDVALKFNLRGLGLNDFSSRLNNVLSQFTTEESDFWSKKKYWVHDIFPDSNTIILFDTERSVLISVPFYITDDRDVFVDFEKSEQVEVAYVPVENESLVAFKEIFRVDENDDDRDCRGVFASLINSGYTPIGQSNDHLLFSNANDSNKVYVIKHEDFVSTKDVEEIVSSLSLLDFGSYAVNNTDDPDRDADADNFVAKSDFEALSALFEQEKERVAELEAELADIKEKCAEFEFEKFKLEAQSFIDEIKDQFESKQDKFVSDVNEKIDGKEITNTNDLRKFVASLLLDKALDDKAKKMQSFTLPPEKDSAIDKGNKDSNKLFKLI